ncbi:MAG TPA: RIP metalloprotease RseP [Vicinamibacterales bacterium]|jgi:regulator of sigma E protease|nr:RIP metalloprotease RseP [Vicinamibacterales bacterium]
MTTLLAFAFVLGVLVFVHELGHFLAAKRVGIRVLKFQLGFNPTIVSFRRGGTEYGIGALPLGGYVKMAGEAPEDVEQDERGNPVRHPDEFMSKTKWERFQVLIMGPVMNILLAFVVLAFVRYHTGQFKSYIDQAPVVGVTEAGSPAERAGIQPGDRIVSIGDRRVDTWKQFFMAIGTRSPNREISIEIERQGQRISKRITPVVAPGQSRFEIADIGVRPNAHPHVSYLRPGDPADKAGLRVGDVITAVNGEPITTSDELRVAIAKHPEQAITLAIARGEEHRSIAVVPRREGDNGLIGIQIGDEATHVDLGPLDAIRASIDENLENATMIGQTLVGLLKRETSPRQLMGPVGIAQMAGETASISLVALFSFMAMISLNLGLVNLLPIPVLDGGHIFIMALEGVARRDFSMRVKEKMLLAGFVLILMLMVTVIYNDLTRIAWIERFMPWR